MSNILKLLTVFLLVVLVSSCGAIIHPSKKIYKKSVQKAPYDVIIVPGYPHDGNNWNVVIQMRVMWANYLYQRKYTNNIIFSGSAVYSPYIESKIMGMYGEALGINKANIYTEEIAEHGLENVYYSYCLARDLGFTKIALATNSQQINQVRQFVRKYDIKIDYIPIVLDTLRELDHSEPEINPELAKRENFVSLPERQSFFKRLKGTFGAYVVWREEDLKKNRHKRKYQDRMVRYSLQSASVN